MNIVELHNVTKEYKGFSLSDINLKIPKGYIMGLIGPNGAGKTTLINIIMNNTLPNKGEVRIFDRLYKENEIQIKENIGFVYDDIGLYGDEKLKVLKKIVAPFYSQWDESKFQRYIKQFDLPLNKKLKELSKGMKMKFSLALALSHNADLLILDEPTSGLDPVFRREFLDLLREILMNENKTILISSHITSELDQIADYVTFINRGKIIINGDKDSVIDSYFVLKGPASKSQDPIIQKLIIGMRSTDTGFEGLIKRENLEGLGVTSEFVLEKPNLEDILFYYDKVVK
ncbi:ABC transporter ATP-binding protein [Priestia aryabhattai]|uniref:ABC transporter ATP-binding protein n=1 Tax=Priestia aryabhattai TaxID=412384 RepID=UPI002E242BE5|nr:ABC transporter ATP-binding protein [Priestia aryabhattai]